MMSHLWQGHNIVKRHILSLKLHLQDLIHSSYLSFLQRLENQFVQAAVEKPICAANEDSISQQAFKVREEQKKNQSIKSHRFLT